MTFGGSLEPYNTSAGLFSQIGKRAVRSFIHFIHFTNIDGYLLGTGHCSRHGDTRGKELGRAPVQEGPAPARSRMWGRGQSPSEGWGWGSCFQKRPWRKRRSSAVQGSSRETPHPPSTLKAPGSGTSLCHRPPLACLSLEHLEGLMWCPTRSSPPPECVPGRVVGEIMGCRL